MWWVERKCMGLEFVVGPWSSEQSDVVAKFLGRQAL